MDPVYSDWSSYFWLLAPLDGWVFFTLSAYEDAANIKVSEVTAFLLAVEGKMSYPHELMVYMQAACQFVDWGTCRKILGRMRAFCPGIYTSLRTKLLPGFTLRFYIEMHSILQLFSRLVGKKSQYQFSPPGCQQSLEHRSGTSAYRTL